MKTLIIAEKPDMGRTIAAVLEPKAQNRRTYLEGENYIITWAIGHLVGLAEPDSYDDRYKKWKAEDLPIIPDQFKLWPNPRTKDQLSTIGELAKRCERLVNACDAGREGQLIFHFIKRYLKLSQPAQRLWISDLTPETIRKGFDSLRSDAEYEPLTRAATARSEADWLIGMNASRAFTIRHRTLLSVGRVQTPVLALLFDRHREITAFNSDTYYIIQAAFDQETGRYRGTWQGDRLTDPEEAKRITEKVKDKQGRIERYEVTESKEYPFRLYDLTLLQREANGKYGFSAKKTLDLAQGLYEKHKVISYPRTNSNYVTEENLPVMGKVLTMLQGTDYKELATGADRSRVHKGNKAVCNPSKVEDHHAILPTPKSASGLQPDEQKLYDMIVRRFLSQYYPPAVYKNHEVITVVESETFKTKVKQQMSPGWKVVLPANNEDSGSKSKRTRKSEQEQDEAEDDLITDSSFSVDQALPVTCTEALSKEKATQPPKPFTEGTLLKAMETAGKAIEDEELKEAMKDTGLGTPATRAATIERLKQVGYITLTGKRLDITPKGIGAIELIRGAGVELLASPEMTGRWEQRLYQISKGEASDEQFMEKVKQFASMIVEKVRNQRPASPALFQEQEKTTAKGKAAAAARKKNSDKQTRGSASSTAATAGGLKIIGDCPRPDCGGQLIEGKRGYGCSRFREGCTFVIWKEMQEKAITAAMAKALAAKGETGKLTFKLQGGQTRKGRIILQDQSSGRVAINYDE